MGLDIYAGTLTRYYAHNWKTAVQQWAEENGLGFHRITPQGEEVADEVEMTPSEIQEIMANWRDQILAALAQDEAKPYPAWPEDNEKPYYTDKPDWDAFGAMLLVAACHTYGEPVPAVVEKGWNYWENPLINRLAEDQERVWSLFRDAIWWLPLQESFMFQAPLPNEDLAVIGTVAALRKELETLNNMAWQADEETILAWQKTEGYPVNGEIGADGTYIPLDAPEEYRTDSLAKFAFSLFWTAMRFAEEQQVPILLDY